mgnify:FL=1
MKSFNQYITELFERPYKWTLRDKHSRDTVPNLGTQDVRYYFKTDDGETMVVRFANNKREGKFRTHIDFFNDNSNSRFSLTGKGGAMKIMSTILDIIKDSIKNVDYDEIRFSASKKGYTSSDDNKFATTGRVKLYRTMVKRFAGKMGYKSKEFDDKKDVDFTMEKK